MRRPNTSAYSCLMRVVRCDSGYVDGACDVVNKDRTPQQSRRGERGSLPTQTRMAPCRPASDNDDYDVMSHDVDDEVLINIVGAQYNTLFIRNEHVQPEGWDQSNKYVVKLHSEKDMADRFRSMRRTLKGAPSAVAMPDISSISRTPQKQTWK